jgi:hypothetical protein
MIDDGRANLEAGLFEQKPLVTLPRSALGAFEPRTPGELRRCQAPCLVDLRYEENQIAVKALNKIPSSATHPTATRGRYWTYRTCGKQPQTRP